ncbi:MAG: hypothetical protein AAGA11_22085 [Pseudomonadota bacterium]
MLAFSCVWIGLIPRNAAGFSTTAIDSNTVAVGFHAVFNHANVSVNIGWPRNIVVTPDVHHRHHGSKRATIDRTYAAQVAFLSNRFGAAVQFERARPARDGISAGTAPRGVRGQLLYPLKRC